MDLSLKILVYAAAILPLLMTGLAVHVLLKNSGGRDIRKKDSLAKRIGMEVIDFASPIGNPEANMATVFAFGKKQPQRREGVMTFRATTGWRYGYISVVLFLIYFCFHIERNTEYAGQTPFAYYLIGALMLLWCGVYMWVFRLETDGTNMRCTTPTLGIKQFDLTLLDSVADSKDGYKLRFADGARITVPQFLEGHGVFKKLMIKTLENNGR